MKKIITYSLIILAILFIGYKVWRYNDIRELSYNVPDVNLSSGLEHKGSKWQRRYELGYMFSKCEGNIFINEMPLFSAYSGKMCGYNRYFNINRYIFNSGPQKLKIELYPVGENDSISPYAEMDFSIEVVDRQFDGYYVLSDSIGNSFVFENDSLDKKKYVYKQSFQANVDYSWPFYDDVEDLRNIEKPILEELVWLASSKLVKNIEKKYFQNIEDVFCYNRVFSNLSEYSLLDDMQFSTYENLKSVINSNFLLEEVKRENLELSIWGDGRFVLVRKKNGNALIKLEDKKNESELLLSIMFFKPKGCDDLFVF